MKGRKCSVSLPEELIMDIFSTLPVKTLLRFKCASKSCCNMITSPEFVKLYLSRSVERNPGVIFFHSGDSLASFDFHHPERALVQVSMADIGKVVGISNGVVCFSHHGKILLYNPATRAAKREFSSPEVKAGVPYKRRDNFCYDSIGDDYKILSVFHYFSKRILSLKTIFGGLRCVTTERSLYSLKSNSWQKIESPPWGDGVWVPKCGTVFANNSFYWISDSKEEVITRFDIWNLSYGMIALSPEMNSFSGRLRLRVLKGHVHLMKSSYLGIRIWMLKEDHDWTLLFRCLEESNFSDWPLPYAYSKDGSKILVGFEKDDSEAFVCCDLNSQTTTMVDHTLGLPKGDKFTASLWVESLVPL